jgi:hypothetical protein
MYFLLMSPFIIYALHNSESNHVYVGQSSKGLKRPQEHSKPATLRREAHFPKSMWIESLKKRGLEPEIAILEECKSAADLNDAERFHIAYFRFLSIPLLNCTEGGDGGAEISRRYWADPEARKKRSEDQLGTKKSEETKSRIAEANRGQKRTPEACERMTEAAEKRWEDPEYRERQIAAQKEAKSSDEAKAKAAEWGKLSSRDSHRTPEYRAKMSEMKKAECSTDEVREQRSASTTNLWKDPEYAEKMREAMRRGQLARRERERRERERKKEDPT